MPDKVQREIEELLDKLDNFVPEERLATKMRERKRQQQREARGPSLVERLPQRLAGITLGHVMLAGIALFLVAFFFDDQLGSAARWVSIGALVLTGGAFVLSIINRSSGSRTPVMRTRPGRVQKVWRGQVIEYGEPTPFERLKGIFRRRGRR
jgi:hypothetical protein